MKYVYPLLLSSPQFITFPVSSPDPSWITLLPMLAEPINLTSWVAENQHLLHPPVNNYCLLRGDATVMIVGSPNERTDYHINQTPGYFQQIKGDMTLKVVDDGEFRDIRIRRSSFLLPLNAPIQLCRYNWPLVEQDVPRASMIGPGGTVIMHLSVRSQKLVRSLCGSHSLCSPY